MKLQEIVIEKSISVVLTIIGSLATAILLWIGTTLQQLTVKMEGVMQRIELNDKVFMQVQEQITIHEYKIDTLDKRVDRIETRSNK
jgi:hypothetical protein